MQAASHPQLAGEVKMGIIPAAVSLTLRGRQKLHGQPAETGEKAGVEGSRTPLEMSR